jgi:predicted RNase H-like HicB family nuclease
MPMQKCLVTDVQRQYYSSKNYDGIFMKTKMTMIYWKGDKFWLGKLQEHPEIMNQGETLEELEENIKDAYRLMIMDDVPEQYQTKEIDCGKYSGLTDFTD